MTCCSRSPCYPFSDSSGAVVLVLVVVVAAAAAVVVVVAVAGSLVLAVIAAMELAWVAVVAYCFASAVEVHWGLVVPILFVRKQSRRHLWRPPWTARGRGGRARGSFSRVLALSTPPLLPRGHARASLAIR